jgi:hypothetical protein
MIKEEKKKDEEKEEKKKLEWSKKLGIDPRNYLLLIFIHSIDTNVTYEMIYAPEGKDEHGATERSHDHGLSKAKLTIFAEKMGYLGDNKVDMNEFLNHQIEEAYLKIEKALNDKIHNIELLQKKVEKLEGNEEIEEEDEQEQTKRAKAINNDSLSAKRRKEKALKPKNKFDIDLVSNQKKIHNLQNTIEKIKGEIQHSKPFEAWKPNGAQDAIIGK